MGGASEASYDIMKHVRRFFRLSPLAQLWPGAAFERTVVLICCGLCGAAPAIYTAYVMWPASDESVTATLSRLPPPSAATASVMQWDQILRRASAVEEWRRLEAFLATDLPVMQPISGSFFGPLSEAARNELRGLPSATLSASKDENTRVETILKQVVSKNPDSVPAQYLLARWYLAQGDASRAYGLLDSFLQRSGGMRRAAALRGDMRSTYAWGPDEQHELLAHSLIRFLACKAAILSDSAIHAIPHCRAAIGASKALQEVVMEPNATTARSIDLMKGTAAAALVDLTSQPSLSTQAFYHALILAYLRAPKFVDTGALMSREILRPPGRQPNDALYTLLMAGTARHPTAAPEHAMWATSNLQRLDIESEPQTPAHHATFDAAVCWTLADKREYLGALADAHEASLRQRAQERIQRAWTTLASDTHTPGTTLKALLGWTSTISGWRSDPATQHRLADLDRSGRAMLASSEVDSKWTALRQTALWTQSLRGREAAPIAEIADTRLGRGPAAQIFASPEEREWLARWYGAVLTDYVPVLGEHIYQQLHSERPALDGETLRVYRTVARRTNQSASANLRGWLREGEGLGLWMTISLFTSDHLIVVMVLMAVLGVLLFLALWLLYDNVCRYRAVVHGCFFRDEHMWMRQ
jgi:hypothetical protein